MIITVLLYLVTFFYPLFLTISYLSTLLGCEAQGILGVLTGEKDPWLIRGTDINSIYFLNSCIRTLIWINSCFLAARLL